MIDPFQNRSPNLSGPAADILPVIPDDANDLPQVAAALYIETGGAIAVVTSNGMARTVTVGDFSMLPVRCSRILASGTTASGIHALLLV